MGSSTGVIRIGTSGIVLPGTKQTFPEEYRSDSRLHYYSTIFSSLEINSTFYKIPIASTFEKWAAEVLGDFQLTVKLWKGITHVKQLAYNPQDIDSFMQRANYVGKKKGCLLVQFPASIKFQFLPAVEKILIQLDQLNSPPQWNICVEFRDPSWYENPLTDEMLNRHHASLVMHDMPASKTPLTTNLGDVAYVRFHGPNGDYKGNYTEEALTRYAQLIKQWAKAGKSVYIYFNNTIGDAFKNALSLNDMLTSDNRNSDHKEFTVKSEKYAL
jgi:uncharacterized protein YecE (DUF72 family)